MQLTSDIQRAWNEGGPKTLVTRTLRKLVRPACKVGTLVFTECDLRSPMQERQVIPGICFREAALDDAGLFDDQALFLKRMKSGSRCFMGIEEATGKLANYRWVDTSSPYIPELKRHLILKPDEAYAYDLKTLPEFRKRGIDGYTRYYTYSYLRDIGYTKVYAYIHGDNMPSLRASRHLLRPVARIRYIHPRGYEPIIIGRLRNGGFPQFEPPRLGG
jgi:GNAT superfamily N-acetyltransferase